MKAVHVAVINIIESLNIHDGRKTVGLAGRPGVHRHRAEPRRIQLVDQILHGFKIPGAGAAALGVFLVGQRPDENARMIPVATDLLFEIRQIFRVAAEPAVFVHDQHSQTVAGIEQFRRRLVVRGADGVAAHFFQRGDTEILQRIGQRGADARRILMVAGALDGIRFSVQQKSVGRVKAHGADAELGFNTVNHFAIAFNRRDQFIKTGRFRRPQDGSRQV